MAYDEELADRIREALSGRSYEEKRMFGGLAFLVGGHLAVAASGRGGLMVPVPADQTEAMLAEPGAETFEMRGRAMNGWVRVRSDAVDDDAVLRTWVDRGLEAAKAKPAR